MNEEILKKQENEPDVKSVKLEETAKAEKEKALTKDESPVEIGKTYKVTEGKKLVIDDKEEKPVSVKKEIATDDKKFPPEYEVKKEEAGEIEGIKSEEPYMHIPDDSTAIVKKRTEGEYKETASEKEVISGKEKTPFKVKKSVAASAKEEIPPFVKRKWMQMSIVSESLKKGGKKVSGAIIKPFKSDNKRLRKSARAVIDISKQPMKAIFDFDRKFTKSMKKVVSFSNGKIIEKSLLKNIKSTDTLITKSAKKMIDSILD